MKLVLQLSCYNGARYLPSLLASLRTQTLQDWRLVILDNASTPEEAILIKTYAEQSGVAHALFRVDENIGFAGAHAYLFQEAVRHEEPAYVALLNDDAILEPTYLEALVQELDAHEESGAAEGIIYRWNFEGREQADQGKTSMLDTVGLGRDWLGRVFDRGSNRVVSEQQLPTTPFQVWGVSGCLPMYRVAAIRSSMNEGIIFDKRLRLYKEDVDLAWAQQHAGWTARTVPGARAFHRRSYGAHLLQWKRPTNETGALSYRNHLWNLFTHSDGRDLLTHPGIIPFEVAKAAYWLIRKPGVVVQAWRETWAMRAWLREKRRFFSKKKQIHANGFRPETPRTHEIADVAIITVTHNDVSEAYLESIVAAKQATPELQIATVVVDNASKQDTRATVQRVLPDAWVLLRNGDHGFGRSCNLGAKQVRAKYYFFLNPDTALPDPLIFRKLIQTAVAHPDAGIIGPKIFYFDGRFQETCRRFPRWFMPLVQRTGLGNTAWGKRYADHFLMRDDSHEQLRAVDWAQGSSLFLPSKAWWELGGFDDRYWLYFEDMDLCRRSWLAGYRVLYNPDIQIKHAHGKMSAKYKNHLLNLLINKEARAHLISWLQYEWKWRHEKVISLS